MYTPTLAQAKALAGSARFVPMYRDILSDPETPPSALLTYEIARCFEKLPVPANDPLQLSLARLLFVDSLLVFDHSRRTIKALTRLPLDGDLEANYREAAERIETMLDRLDGPPQCSR